MSKIALSEQDNSTYRDQQFISISYNGNTNNVKGSTPQPYELPIASATTLSGIKVGNNLNITSDGTLSAVGGSGGGTQPDWNQSDSTAPDYIKNRPFYKEVGEEITESFIGDEIDFDLEDYPNEVSLMKSEFSHEISEGVETTLTLSGESGQLVTKSGITKLLTIGGISALCIGNPAIGGMGEDTGEDYLFYFIAGEAAKTATGGEFYGQYTQIDGFTEAVTKVEFSLVPVVYHKLDKVYIPELDGYIKSSPSVTENNSNIVIGKNVYVEEQSSKNVIASDNMTIVDIYNPDRHNAGLYYMNKGEQPLVGNIYLSDQTNIFIGTPVQEDLGVGDISDTGVGDYGQGYVIITPDPERNDFDSNIKYITPNLYDEEQEQYFNNFDYYIGAVCHEYGGSTIKLLIDSFYPKDVTTACAYGYLGIHYETSAYQAIFTEFIAEVERYQSETSKNLEITAKSEIMCSGGQGNIVIGTDAGATEDTGDSIVIGHGAFIDGDTYWGDNIAIGRLAKVTATHASIAIGGNTSVKYGEHVVIGSGTSDYNEDEDVSYSINIKDKIRIIDNNKDVEFPESRAMIIKSSTPGSTKKFKITVDDTGTISATEV